MRDPSAPFRTRGPRTLLVASLAAIAALVALAGGVRSGEPDTTFVLGDVDCDGELTSLDAVFVLQYGAGLLDTLPCPDNGDPSGDGLTTSLDATLVLQHTAGLVDDFVTFALAVHRPEGVCDDSSVPVKCDIPVASEFGVSILVGHPPTEGYIGIQAMLYHGDLRYNPAALPSEEVVWPEAGLNLRTQREGSVVFGLISNAVPPFGVSHHHGTIVELSMTCPPDPRSFTISLPVRGGPAPELDFGAHFSIDSARDVNPVETSIRDVDLDFDGTIDSDEEDIGIAAELEVNCVEAPAP